MSPKNTSVFLTYELFISGLQKSVFNWNHSTYSTLSWKSFVIFYRCVGSIWLLTKVIAWKIILVNSHRLSTLTTWSHSVSCWRAPLYRTNCLSCGLWWISCYRAFLTRLLRLSHGLMLRFKWLARRWSWTKKKHFWSSDVFIRWVFIVFRKFWIKMAYELFRVHAFTENWLSRKHNISEIA